MAVTLLLALFNLPVAAEEKGDTDNHWFVFGGMMNYHTRLEESERQIDEQINGVFGRLIRGWNDPRTFKDWSDEWLLWDAFAEFGCDISPENAAKSRDRHTFQMAEKRVSPCFSLVFLFD